MSDAEMTPGAAARQQWRSEPFVDTDGAWDRIAAAAIAQAARQAPAADGGGVTREAIVDVVSQHVRPNLIKTPGMPTMVGLGLNGADEAADAILSRLGAGQAGALSECLKALEPFARLQAETVVERGGEPGRPKPDDRVAWAFNRADLTWGHFNEAARVYSKHAPPPANGGG
jgi:hypothetical protein